jgi:preprotein translocase subunit SecF
MELFNPNSNVDFMGARKWAGLFSVIICLVSLMSLGIYGLQWGLDFTGGIQIEMSYPHAANIQSIRDTLYQHHFKDAQVVNYGSSQDVLITIAPHAKQNPMDIVEDVIHYFPDATKKRVDIVGPQVGKELATKGILAIVVSLLAILIYVAMRFEYRLGFSAIVALIHDPILILGLFSFFHIEFDLKALAGLLAVIGYSLNDTIVVFDRVRENFVHMRRASPIEIMNASINQTLSRTIMTSFLTLLVVVALFVYGGETIRGFADTLIIGIIVGTYSSIYVAGALAVALGLDKKDFVTKTKVVDDRP